LEALNSLLVSATFAVRKYELLNDKDVERNVRKTAVVTRATGIGKDLCRALQTVSSQDHALVKDATLSIAKVTKQTKPSDNG
jgi:hypothetical protein